MKHLFEGRTHLLKNIASTAACQTAHPFKRGKECAIEKQIAGKWHIITLQEGIEYVDHELFTNRFHVAHYGGCAVLFNKDTFFPDVKVKSIYLHDTRRVFA